MRFVKHFAAVLAVAAGFAYAPPAKACPLCKEAAESAVDLTAEQDDDPLAEAKAYNRTIYMMIGVPYTIFAVGGFYCYRHLRGRGTPVEG
jgi:hypothetical protein